ncbi:MAG TPA: N-acetylmuramoyl-L-alanine amidase [Bacteroidales bacterium]|nr:N-acetylmuramoyl-L-alanine amidase [Bacteroidales bacterium]
MNKTKYTSILLLFCTIYIYAQNGFAQTQAYTIKTVVIDAGHGGKDPGAVGKVAKEKDITLALALKTGNYIQKNIPSVKIIYTRSTDVFVELHKRAEIANKNNADVFISIHVNASTNKEAYGTDTWIMGLHKNKANLEVAKLENKVIMVEDNYSTKYQGMSADSTEAIIIHTMMQSANIEHSARLASMVQKEFRERVGRKDRGVHTAPFMVLWKTTMPSILIETGFISNAEEEQFLITEQGQDYMASAIYRAFKDYKTAIETKSNIASKQDQATQSTQNQTTTPKQQEPIKQTNSTPHPSHSEKTHTEPTTVTQSSKSVDTIPAIVSQQSNNTQTKPLYSIQDSTLQLVKTETTTPQPIPKPTVQTVGNQPKPVQQTIPPITSETKQKEGITYSIQIAASKQIIEIKPENFKGFTNVYSIQEDSWNKYYIGTYYTFKEISVPFQQIKAKYPEAFIVARKDGKKITIQQAKSITQ